jgi:hypothetical protein
LLAVAVPPAGTLEGALVALTSVSKRDHRPAGGVSAAERFVCFLPECVPVGHLDEHTERIGDCRPERVVGRTRVARLDLTRCSRRSAAAAGSLAARRYRGWRLDGSA